MIHSLTFNALFLDFLNKYLVLIFFSQSYVPKLRELLESDMEVSLVFVFHVFSTNIPGF